MAIKDIKARWAGATPNDWGAAQESAALADIAELLGVVERVGESLDELIEAACDEVHPLPATIKKAQALLDELEGDDVA